MQSHKMPNLHLGRSCLSENDMLRSTMGSNAFNDNISKLAWPFIGPASSMSVDITQEDGSLMTRSASGRVREAKARRKMYPKEQWLAMKPVIQQLYADEGRTFAKVVEYLHEFHSFNPT
jgi:hypothetical protein